MIPRQRCTSARALAAAAPMHQPQRPGGEDAGAAAAAHAAACRTLPYLGSSDLAKLCQALVLQALALRLWRFALLRAGDRTCNSCQTYIRMCLHKLCIHHCRCRRCGRAGDAGAAAAARAAPGVGPCRGAHAGGGGARAPAHHAAGVDLHSQRCGEVVVH